MNSRPTKAITRFFFAAMTLCLGADVARAGDGPPWTRIDFDDTALALAPESQWDGVDDIFGDGVGTPNTFTSRGATFNNNHQHEDWGHAWQGWAYSNRTDTGTTGFAGQYTAVADPAGGHDGSSQYGVGFLGFSEGPRIEFAGPVALASVQLTNSAFAHDSMSNGDGFAKKFGGESGDDEDWLLLTVIGKLRGMETGSIEFYLADFRFEDNHLDYIVSNWTELNLMDLGVVDAIEFNMASTDNGDFGMNTPAYFAMDSLVANVLGGYADFDADGDVDGDDFIAWQAGFGGGAATRAQGDADADGDVDGDDFLVWQSEFGSVAGGEGTASGAMIPEPSAAILMLVAATTLAAISRKRAEFAA